MNVTLREKKVGPYVVRELPMRETLRVLKEHPDGDERGIAILGASVSNGTGAPLGMAVAELGTGLYRLLMDAHSEVTGRPTFDNDTPAGEQGNG